MKHFVICETSVVDNVIEFPVLGDRCVDDLLREVISTDVPTNGDGVSSERLDLLNNELSFLFVQVANYNLRAFLSKDNSSTPPDPLLETGASYEQEMLRRECNRPEQRQ